jgi:uncharacterized protein YcgI (DUF1989 family)
MALISDEILPPAASWSRICLRATALTLTDVEGGANVSALLYRASDPLERYCMPDTLKAQHVSRLTAGVALYSDMGRVLASVTADSCGWHDTITGHATAARDGLLAELARHGLGQRDLVANCNLFSKVAVGADGALEFVAGNSPAGASVTLRFELDTLVVLCNTPHPLDPAPAWNPQPVRLELEQVVPATPDDRVRRACAENARGFAASEAVLW